ncbi:MAG TPA: winged helix-turn-helix transcriptional regulator [Dehalococcoidia bacterium]|nr:winged helix-turn-helix transcriptional regulator [Dehalococcoidia bacterium]
MQSTKSHILSHLKRHGGSSVDELAQALGLAHMTVRQHLTGLERDGLISSREVRRATGRPHHIFVLAEKAEEEVFPKRYDRLANLMLEEIASLESGEIAGLSSDEKKQLLFRKMTTRLARRYAPRLQGKPLPERVQLVASILETEGGFAEWRKSEAGFEIIDYNCIYRKVAAADDHVCDWHVNLLAQLLGQDVSCNQFARTGEDCCRFLVTDPTEGRA